MFLDRATAHDRVDASLHGAFAQPPATGPVRAAWEQHVLLVPLRERDGRLVGAVWADDPADRLKPSPETMQSLRAFANHAMGAIESAHQLELMRHLAEHDPLTGLRNRRGLQEHIDAEIARTRHRRRARLRPRQLQARQRRARLRAGRRGASAVRRRPGGGTGGLAARLGGEEFALVLAGTCEDAALATAERVRTSVLRGVRRLPVAGHDLGRHSRQRPGRGDGVAAAARSHARGLRRQAARPRPLHPLPRGNARGAARHARGRRRGVERAARGRDAARRDARPA